MATVVGSIKSYMEAGASAVVLSDAIFDKELMRERNSIASQIRPLCRHHGVEDEAKPKTK